MQAWPIIWLAGALIMVTGCNPTAAQRLARASEIIAPRVGARADDVARSFQARMAGSSDEVIALQAERTAQRTAWIDDVITRMAQERTKTAKVVHGAACEWLEVANALAEETQEERYRAFYVIIVRHLRAESLPESDAKIREVWATIESQIESLRRQGSIDVGALSTDLACLF